MFWSSVEVFPSELEGNSNVPCILKENQIIDIPTERQSNVDIPAGKK